MGCPLCGAAKKHFEDCPNPYDEPQHAASFAYFRYLSRVEDEDEPNRVVLFGRWLLYRFDRVFGF